MSNFDTTPDMGSPNMADDPRAGSVATARAVRAAERAWSGLYGRGGLGGAVSRVVPGGWTARARRVLRALDDRLRAANERAEEALLAIARDFERDPDCLHFARGVRGLLRLDRVWGWVRDRRWRLERKMAQLATAERRAELREALGGETALSRWEAAWDRSARAERRGERPLDTAGEGRGKARPYDVVEGCGLRGCDCVACGGEFRGYDFTDGVSLARQDALRAEFRLAGVPRRKRVREVGTSTRAARRPLRPSGHLPRERGRTRGMRIPVWPGELREREVQRARRARRVWVREDRAVPAGARSTAIGDIVKSRVRGRDP